MDIKRELQLRLNAANLLIRAQTTRDAMEQADLMSQAQRMIWLANAQSRPNAFVNRLLRNRGTRSSAGDGGFE